MSRKPNPPYGWTYDSAMRRIVNNCQCEKEYFGKDKAGFILHIDTSTAGLGVLSAVDYLKHTHLQAVRLHPNGIKK